MAVVTTNIKKLNSVRLFSRADDAIDQDATDWDAYEDNPMDESLIKLVAGKEATVFLCNFEFKGKDKAKVDDAVFGAMDKDAKSPKVNYSGWAYEVVRHSLKDIQNPADVKDVIKLKKDSGTLVAPETMTMLNNAGIVSEIFKYWLALRSDSEEKANAKKS